MIPLLTQPQFEELLKPEKPDGKPADPAVVVYFTAPWCGACKNLDLDRLEKFRNDIIWYKCDIDQNTYSLGYAGLQKIPAFVLIKFGKFVGGFTNNKTDVVMDLIQDTF